MKHFRMLAAVGLLAASLLSGCVIVPGDGWGRGDYHRRYGYERPYYGPYAYHR